MVRGTGNFKTKRGGGSNFSPGVVLDNDGIAVSRASRGGNAKKEDAPGTIAGAAQPQLTCTERRKLYRKRAAQKQDGTGGMSSRDLMFDQNGVAASKASRGENARKGGATGTRADAAQRQLMRTKRRKLYKKRAAQKRDGTGRAFSRYLVLDQNGIAVPRASRGKNGKKENAAGTRAGATQSQLKKKFGTSDLGPRELTRKERSRRKNAKQDEGDGDDEEDDVVEEENEEEEKDAAGTSAGVAQPELSRIERRELKKKQAAEKQGQKKGIDEDDKDADLINPNNVEKKLNISDPGSRELTRKERKAKEVEERYWELHLAGKTEEAKSDVARLKKIKGEREAAQAKRKAKAETKAAEIEARNVERKCMIRRQKKEP